MIHQEVRLNIRPDNEKLRTSVGGLIRHRGNLEVGFVVGELGPRRVMMAKRHRSGRGGLLGSKPWEAQTARMRLGRGRARGMVSRTAPVGQIEAGRSRIVHDNPVEERRGVRRPCLVQQLNIEAECRLVIM